MVQKKHRTKSSYENSSAFSGTLVDKVFNTLKNKIQTREFTPNNKLPSIREMAGRMGVSKSTVVDAYDRLVAQNLIISKPKSGFFVTHYLPPLDISDIGAQLEKEVDPLWMARQSLNTKNDYLKPGCGWLPNAWLPENEIRKAIRVLSKSDANYLMEYSPQQGLFELRQLISQRYSSQMIESSPNNILLTDNGSQAIDLICRLLLNPGDKVIIDDPSYFNFQMILKANQAETISVPYTKDGPDVDLFEKALIQHKPRLYITNSGIQNPTGARLGAQIAHKILTLAEQHNMYIIEDDIFSDFMNTPFYRYASFDARKSVLLIGSFSKTMSASIRCGYIICNENWLERLIDLKLATSFSGNTFSQGIIYQLLKSGSYNKYLDTLRGNLSSAMTKVQHSLIELNIEPWFKNNQGMFLWCKLPNSLNAAKLSQKALAHNVILAPGNGFSYKQSSQNFMRFNVAQSLDEKLYATLKKLL